MAMYDYLDNQQCGSLESEISFLNGVLTAFQFINHKTDSGFDFSLKGFGKRNHDLQDTLKQLYNTKHETKLCTIKSDRIGSIVRKWLFSFLPGLNYSPRQSFLTDRNNDFSVSDSSDQNLFIDEFVARLVEAIKPNAIYHGDFTTTSFWTGSTTEIIVLETDEQVYLLSFSWND